VFKQCKDCLINIVNTLETYGGVNLDKYNKMKSLGVPLEAIEHKMTMDGLNRDCIKYWMDFTKLVSVQAPPPPPLPPPLPTLLTRVNNGAPKPPIAKLGFLKDIMSNNFALKRVQKEHHNVNMTKKLKNRFGYEPPSLDDIVNARSNLKKVSSTVKKDLTT
jgi:hypothetical protein